MQIQFPDRSRPLRPPRQQTEKTRHVSLRMADMTYDIVQREANSEGRSFSNMLTRLIELGLDQYRIQKQLEKEVEPT